MTTLSIRIEEKTKKDARKVLTKIGLDISGAVKIFLHQLITEDGLPFLPTNNPAAIKALWEQEAAEVLRTGKRYRNARELHREILK